MGLLIFFDKKDYLVRNEETWLSSVDFSRSSSGISYLSYQLFLALKILDNIFLIKLAIIESNRKTLT
ncbi:hypothetical protein EGX80_02850 [Streptococcus pyogenes]|nr:hypothetical protein DMC40_02690 [Streptococcus pyogenes]AYZ09114.1 hypothetical protein EGX80_02850 [Streptococcus pyogenes]TNY42502.1 hypothetical protein FGO81_03375 [Streptococcus pyogenes]TNY42596.1 hypothetical protein FGC30_06355 [Streptococcus pyogenes]TYK80877.1 hypothetical protein E0F52_08170 [Streptococcus pyogenes]